VIKTTTNADITVELPEDVQLSALPMSGKYRIECNVDGYQPTYSNDIDYTWDAALINNAIEEGCHQMRDIIEVKDGPGYLHPQNGK
jgi:hypothetical protein